MSDESSRDVIRRIAVGLIWNESRLAVGRRSRQSVLAGYDEFPGGKCEPGETPEAAVRRECLEETGLTIGAVKLRMTVRHDYDYGRLEIHFYDCLPEAGASELIEPFHWTTLEETRRLRFPPANDAVLTSIFERPGYDAAPT
jgi:mutator protein MutT